MLVGNIIYLNGTSSAGKSSLARALQDRLATPYLLLGLDHINDAFPARFIAVQPFGQAPPPVAQQGFVVRQETREDGLHLDIQFGPAGRRFITGFRHAIRAFAVAGNDIIVDDVLYGQDLLAECAAVLAGLPVTFVKVHCPLEEIERREQERADRLPGLAAWQQAHMHGGVPYDLEVDTSRLNPDECAERVVAVVNNPPGSRAFARLLQSHAGKHAADPPQYRE